MPSQHDANKTRSRDQPQETTRVFDPLLGGSEDILSRNYDHQNGYDLHLVGVTQAGDTAFQKRYYRQPGETVSECAPFSSADYTTTVILDNTRETAGQCRIDSFPGHTAVIEIGNETLSRTEDLYS